MTGQDWLTVGLCVVAVACETVRFALALAESAAARRDRRFANVLWRVGEETGQIRITP